MDDFKKRFKIQARQFDLLNNCSADLSMPNADKFANDLSSHFGNGDTVALIVGDSRDILDNGAPNRLRSAKYYTFYLVF